MKRLVALLAGCVLLLTAACGKSDDQSASSNKASSSASSNSASSSADTSSAVSQASSASVSCRVSSLDSLAWIRATAYA